jgi:methyl-accepting chemotaxis protein
MPGHPERRLIRGVLIRIALTLVIVQGVFLFSSEFFNTSFNNRFDAAGLSALDRIPVVFKGTVLGIFAASLLIQFSIILWTLRPMFRYLRDGTEYDRARLSAVKLPWRFLTVQALSWFLGVTAYYFLRRWDAESGIPYFLGLALKIAGGLVSSLYDCIIINIILVPAKRLLSITDIREGENDLFVRIKDPLIVLSAGLFIAVSYSYLAYYLVGERSPIERAPLVFALWGLFFVLACLGLAVLSSAEYRIQANFLKRHMLGLINKDSSEFAGKVHILYFDETGEFGDLFNRFHEKFRGLLEGIVNSASQLSSSVQDLSSTTKEVTSTSNMQAAAVKEVVSTMEDSNTISRSVGASVSEVARIALKTKENVDSGTVLVQETLEKMVQIRKKNTDSISGIRALADKIRAIWEIVDIINQIVEQTRIIAFNAALEASTAGEAGDNFQIVASEIKRLADSTADSTAEIQARITEIQKAANNLIVVSEEGTERIRQGHEITDRLHSVFSDILTSADISATSSETIERSIRQQLTAFEQILVTMKEISMGIDSLVGSQKQTSHTAESLASMADGLRAYAAKFEGEGGNER